MIELAKQLSKKGYSVIPVGADKTPTVWDWGKYQMRPMTEDEIEKHFKGAYGIAMLMGTKLGLTAVDFDLKYSLTTDFYERVKSTVPVGILRKLYVQSTRNGGFHWIWKCPERMEGNQKLAQRLTTPEEKHEVYLEEFKDINRRANALKTASNHKVKVLIETRGDGGYILLNPTPGYEHVYGKVQELTPEEHDTVLEAMRQFNEYVEPVKNFKMYNKNYNGVNPFEEFNKRGDALKLLLDNGWTITYENHSTVRLRRPGNDASPSSAMYDLDTKILNVFSTSTVFDVGRGYMPANVFTVLEADNDTGLAFTKLCELGFNEVVE